MHLNDSIPFLSFPFTSLLSSSKALTSLGLDTMAKEEKDDVDDEAPTDEIEDTDLEGDIYDFGVESDEATLQQAEGE